MRGGPRALGRILSCTGLAGALALAACSSSDDSGEPSSTTTSSTTTTTLAPGPVLDTNTDDVEAAMRSLLEFEAWAEEHPAAAIERLADFSVDGGPDYDSFHSGLSDQVSRQLVATGRSEVLDVVVESQDGSAATVLVWKRADAFDFVGPTETLPSPAFERRLFIYELVRGDDGQWRVFDRRIPSTA